MTDTSVLVDGDGAVRVTPDGDWETTTRVVGFRCTSGDWVEAAWTGVDLAAALDAAGVPAETTHLVVESDDEYRVCLPVADCLDALVAFDGETEPESDRPTANEGTFPRVVAPGIDGPHTPKNAARIEPVALDAGEDRADRETLP
ncbi:molybdopterin-dependent oxidoreductase (plasmid) [Halobacterium sp. NMX12-1]|jgi:DMSO/TMAO reductase YedYZ molybdopterin-dependent catalytic subunit|uniref:Molybdopterin-dependent oxidoreductase n=1 Tax=Halobacterium sp. NMX12-1 TaxID=3166650 RepID=A0AAU8CGR7_9EURY